MAKSASQKKLAHKLKNGINFDPRRHRGDFGDITGVKKATPTLVAKQRRQENKHKGKNRYGQKEDHTYCCVSGL